MISSNPFKIGDIVYILGKYVPSDENPVLLLKCKIDHIRNRQFIAYRTDGGTGEWRFSRKHHNRTVFTSKNAALNALHKS